MTRLDVLLEERQYRRTKMLEAKARLDDMPLIPDHPASLHAWQVLHTAWADRNAQYRAAHHALTAATAASRAAS